MLSSLALAAPLMDYSTGKTAIDISVYPNLDTHLSNNTGYNESPKGKSGNYEFGVTTGLGDKFAIQYRNFSPETKSFGQYHDVVELKNQEINMLYKLNNNLSAFAGYNWTKVHDSSTRINGDSETKGTTQVGVIASTQIAQKTTLFGKLGVGNDLTNYQLGISYCITPNLDFNICYNYLEVKKVTFGNLDLSGECKGLGYGLTYKF
jgi:predicted porin